MARYIDVDKFAEKICNFQEIDEDSANKMIYLLRTFPTADVEEVKHGEWIQEWELEKGLEDNDEIPYIKCSLCGHMEWGIDKEMDITPNYCNECGAKMGGGKEE